MKKIFAGLIIVLLLITGCSKEVSYDDKGNAVTPEPTSDTEKVLFMIKQCIDDYNSGTISELEKQWGTTINPLPLDLEQIPQVDSLSQLKNVKITDRITSSVYDGSYDVGKYTIIFEIYNYGTNFWLNGKSSFLINVDSIEVNNPAYSDIKKTLDTFLSEDREVLAWLYGVNVELGQEHQTEKGYYKVNSIGKYKYNSIQELKNKADSIFTQEFLTTYYSVAFDAEDPIYKEIDGNLYCSLSESNIYDGLPYDTTRIISIKELDTEVLVDIVVKFGDDVSPELQRIKLVKTDAGLRFANVY